MKLRFFISLFFSAILSLPIVLAHCPLCTMGAGAAAAGAVWLGVSKVVVALFLGAFAMSMGMWFSRVITKHYFSLQKPLILIGVFLLTVLPLLPLVSAVQGFYLSLFGDYGSLFNRTYVIPTSLLASLIGGFIVFASPNLSRKITESRSNHTVPFQGIALTFILLLITGGIIQLLL